MNSQTNKHYARPYNRVYTDYGLSPLGTVQYGKNIGVVVPTCQLGNSDMVVVSFDREEESVTRIISAHHLYPVRSGQVDRSTRVRTRYDESGHEADKRGKRASMKEVTFEVIQKRQPLR